MGCRYFCLHVLVDPGMGYGFFSNPKKKHKHRPSNDRRCGGAKMGFWGPSVVMGRFGRFGRRVRKRYDPTILSPYILVFMDPLLIYLLLSVPSILTLKVMVFWKGFLFFCVAKKWEVKQGFKTRAIFERIIAKPSSSVFMPMRVLLKMVGFVGNPVMMCVALKLNLRVTRFPKLYIEKPWKTQVLNPEQKEKEFGIFGERKGDWSPKVNLTFLKYHGGVTSCLLIRTFFGSWFSHVAMRQDVINLYRTCCVLSNVPRPSVFSSVFFQFSHVLDSLEPSAAKTYLQCLCFLLALTNSRFQFHSLWAYERRKTHLALQKKKAVPMGKWDAEFE